VENLEVVDKPWGYYKVLEQTDISKSKVIVVNPGCKLSLQRHKNRSEEWEFRQGKAFFTLGFTLETLSRMPVQSPSKIIIPKYFWHRVENCGDEELIIFEVQIGTKLEEEDIERAEDDYGRI